MGLAGQRYCSRVAHIVSVLGIQELMLEATHSVWAVPIHLKPISWGSLAYLTPP